MNKMTMDIDSILKKYSLVEEVNEVVGVWEINIENCPITLKIKVLKMAHLSNYPYMGFANYGIQNLTQADPYTSLHNFKTSQEALEDSIKGFLTFFEPELIEDTKFVLNERW